jgi:alpha-beta hydrolase superfamily lysophospholipase
MVALTLAFAAWAAPTALLVTTPGLDVAHYRPLVEALREGGTEVALVAFPCSGDVDDAVAAVARAGAELPEGYVVVAHGLGATLALAAGPALAPSRWVLLAPVLDIPDTKAARYLATLEVGGGALGAARPEWNGRDLSEVLLGGEASLGCVAPALAREVRGWMRAGDVPLPLERIAQPVWIGLGLLDEVAATEVAVEASRRLARRELVRLGVTRFDPRDYGHLDLLMDPVPVEAAARAVRVGPGGERP